MLIFGAGGHAKVVIDCMMSNRIAVSAIFDDEFTGKSFRNIQVFHSYRRNIFSNEKLIIAIGDNETRKIIADKVQHDFSTVSHPSAVIAEDVAIGQGTVILHQSVIQSDTKIGRHVIINTSASVDHDCNIADYVHIAPGSVLCGGVHVGEGALIGAGSIILPNVRIGSWAKVGAGAVVNSDVIEDTVVVGVPAKVRAKEGK